MRILVVEPGGYAGTFQYAHNLADALAQRGHEVGLATGVAFETRAYPRRYEAIEAFDRFLPRPGRMLALARWVRRHRPEIVHIQGHLHPTSYLALRGLFRRLCRAHYVYTAQDVFPKRLKLHHRWTLPRLYREMEHIFVNAEQNRRSLLDRFPVDPAKVSAIPLADLTHFVHREGAARSPEVPPGRPVALFFGILEPRKGLAPLIEAFALARERVPGAFLLVAGKPFEDVAPYEEAVRRVDPGGEHIRFRPGYLPLDQVPGVLGHVRVVVLPYTQGWNSAVIATAYAYGQPVIASDLGGFREVVDDGGTGLLVPPGDVPALADAMARVLGDDALRSRLSAGALARARAHGWPQIAERVEAVYRRLRGEG